MLPKFLFWWYSVWKKHCKIHQMLFAVFDLTPLPWMCELIHHFLLLLTVTFKLTLCRVIPASLSPLQELLFHDRPAEGSWRFAGALEELASYFYEGDSSYDNHISKVIGNDRTYLMSYQKVLCVPTEHRCIKCEQVFQWKSVFRIDVDLGCSSSLVCFVNVNCFSQGPTV